MGMTLRIPKDDRSGLGAILRVSSEQLEALKAALETCQLQTARSDIASSLTKKLEPIFKGSAESAAKVIVSLYYVRVAQEMSASDLAETVIDTVKESKTDDYGAQPSDWTQATENLRTLLSFDSTLGISTKAAFLSSQVPSHLGSARILTDARPVFPTDASAGPAAFLISHTLQIEVHVDGDEKEYFISLDDSDLDALADAASRAKVKETALRKSLESAKVPVIDRKGVDNVD
jgi:hypothetical protein